MVAESTSSLSFVSRFQLVCESKTWELIIRGCLPSTESFSLSLRFFNGMLDVSWSLRKLLDCTHTTYLEAASDHA